VYLMGVFLAKYANAPHNTRKAPLHQPIKPRKSLGQNFLTDHGVVERIVDSIQAKRDQLVIEIGPGTGALTTILLKRFDRFRAIEIDNRAVDVLKQRHPGIDILQMDVLDSSWFEHLPTSERIAVIGNLPYYITSPILFLLIDNRERFSEAVIMVQKEVAERLVATPGNKTYGILSVQVQLAATVEYLFTVHRNAFYPQPNVDSAIIRLTFDKPVPDVDGEHLRRVIRQAFSQKRKMLRNTLSPIMHGINLDEWDLTRRAETLSLDEFVQLAKELYVGT
jgi:16S rRNA (adenine1518-N6/adenine1519-N6)-dimethyltransferase